jgi:hypothetical protein
MGAAVHDAFPVDLMDAIFGMKFIDGNIDPRTGGPFRHVLMKPMT